MHVLKAESACQSSLIDSCSRAPCRTVIIQLVHHRINIFNLSLSTSMDYVSQHGSSSGYNHDGPDFLIAQQHLQAVADMLAGTTFQAMDADPRADATASLSAIRAMLSPSPEHDEFTGKLAILS